MKDKQCKNEHNCSCELNTKVFGHPKKRSPFGTWKCYKCDVVFETRRKLQEHNHKCHPVQNGHPWNKGLTKEDPRVAKGIATLKKHFYDGSIKPSMLGRHLSNKHKKKISDSMKKAHSEGRAHNIGECRWNNEPSYPEKFFMKVIDNEFINKNYVREKPFGRFSLDFAWIELKRCIEIDGKQHETDKKQKIRDVAKDNLLHENGWKVLRIKWSDMYHNPKLWIKKAKDFIDR